MTAPSILIVEDEPLITMMLEDFLDTLGYRVAGTADRVADGVALACNGDCDAAIIDVNLRDGEASWPVADALKAAGKPFLIATGGQGDSIAPEHAGAPILSKPFTMDGVRTALEGLLARTG